MKHFKGCLLEAFERGDVKIIAHQVNCFTMGSGIAGQIKKKWPQHARDHKIHIDLWGGERTLGTSFYTHVEGVGIVEGLVGQYNYGRDGKRYTNYKALIDALEWADFCQGDIIGIPKYMSCGLAGGDWSIVEQLLQDFETMEGVEFWVYEK